MKQQRSYQMMKQKGMIKQADKQKTINKLAISTY